MTACLTTTRLMGGPAAPFDQDSILDFQVLTSGDNAEFGHGSGGVVNVVSKSGTGRVARTSLRVPSQQHARFLRRPRTQHPFPYAVGSQRESGRAFIKDRVFAFPILEFSLDRNLVT